MPEQVDSAVQAVQPEVKKDIFQRLAEVKQEPKAQDSQVVEDVNFDFKELENIKDPQQAKSWAEKAYKSMQGGFTKKFNELAELRKSVDAQKQQMTKWTPERIQQELNNPEFVQAASLVANTTNQNPKNSGLTDEEYSALSDREKAEITALKQQVAQLQQVNSNSVKYQEDMLLSSRYPDYSPQEIDTITADMLAGKVQATREHIYKAFKFEDSVRKAYELGKQDALKENQEKARAVSATNIGMQGNREVPKLQQGQSREAHFTQIALARLAEMGQALRK